LAARPSDGTLCVAWRNRAEHWGAAMKAVTTPRVLLVGAGPGDPDLLTLKAIKALRQATVALVDDLVHPGALKFLRRSARVIHVGKRGGCASTPQAFIHKLMVAEAVRGERVVRLKGGDPFVFGRGGEECDALREAGIEVEVIAGVTAGMAGPASIGVPVTDRRHTRGVVLVTGHTGDPGNEVDWHALARCGLTLVIYMGVARVQAIVQALRVGGLPGDTPAAVVCSAHTPAQRQAVCTLATLAETLQREGLGSPAILVIGDVVQASPMWAASLQPEAALSHG
jgi:uroporphyrin-III C-methyltransferase